MFVHHAYGHQFAAEMDRIRQRKVKIPRWILKAGWVGAWSTTRVKLMPSLMIPGTIEALVRSALTAWIGLNDVAVTGR